MANEIGASDPCDARCRSARSRALLADQPDDPTLVHCKNRIDQETDSFKETSPGVLDHDTSAGQLAIDIRDLERKFAHIGDDSVVGGTVHMRQIVGAGLVDGDAEGVDAVQAGLEEGLTGVFDSVFAAVLMVVVVGFAVGERDQELDVGLLLGEQVAEMTDGHTHSSVVARDNAADAGLGVFVVGLAEGLDRIGLAAFAGPAREAVDGEAIAERVERLGEQDEGSRSAWLIQPLVEPDMSTISMTAMLRSSLCMRVKSRSVISSPACTSA